MPHRAAFCLDGPGEFGEPGSLWRFRLFLNPAWPGLSRPSAPRRCPVVSSRSRPARMTTWNPRACGFGGCKRKSATADFRDKPGVGIVLCHPSLPPNGHPELSPRDVRADGRIGPLGLCYAVHQGLVRGAASCVRFSYRSVTSFAADGSARWGFCCPDASRIWPDTRRGITPALSLAGLPRIPRQTDHSRRPTGL